MRGAASSPSGVELGWAAGCVAAALCVAWPSPARAEQPEAVAPAAALATAPAGEAVAAPVLLATRGDALEVARLSALLGVELGRRVVLEREREGVQGLKGVVTVTYRRAAGELAVTWEHDGQTLTRVVAAPVEGAIEGDAAMLAGNLAREQVDELLPGAPAPPPAAAEPPPAEPQPMAAPPEHWFATVGVFYPLSTHYGHPEVTSGFDLNLLYSRVGSIDGGQLGGVNVVGRDAGAPASMRGLQVGVLANVVAGDTRGVQAAGLLNQVSGDTEGAQLSFGANLAQGSVEGLQGALLFNRAGSMDGLQLSAVNVAGDVNGVQIGLVNIAHRVRGASIGLVNIADDIDGLPLAPFSVTRTGGVHPLAWSGSSGLGNVGVKLATRHTYTLFFGSYHRAYGLELVGGGFALGGSVELGAGFRSDIDLCGTYLVAPALSQDPSRERGYHEQLVQPRLRLMLGYRLASHLGVFAGAAALGQVRAELGWDRVTASVGPEIFAGLEL
jgi:hypothetical protein